MTTTYYLGGVLDASLLTTANDASIASGATAVGKDTPIGTKLGYGELCPNGAPGTWPAYISEAAVPFSGKGNIYPVALANQAILSGNGTPTLRCSVVGTSPSAITADLIVRVWLWNSVSRTATKYGVITLAAQTIGTTSTTFAFSAASLGVIAGGPNDYLCFDTLANITSNPNGSSVNAKIRTNFSNSASQGNATAQVVMPSMAPCRIIPTTAALQGTFSRTIPTTASLAFSRTIPTTASLSGSPRRIIPTTASLCRGPLGAPYVQTIADSHYISASGTHLVYRGNQIKLYGATIYLSTQGGAATWQNGDASAVLDDLFQAAFKNGVAMLRITDFWDGGHITAMDNPQLWANIDYCVTRAQQLGMFVMMDVSAFKNVLTANGQDYTVAANWHDWLTFVGYHYRNCAPSICWYNILGEPSVPADQAGCNALGAFYGNLCNYLHAADNGTHLIEAAGLTHMNTVVAGLTDPAWWYQIYTLTNNNICGYKTYSVNDLVYLSTVRSIMTANSINKPLVNNEFGGQQEQGDAAFPAFTNTLASGITAGNTVTALALNTAIAQTIVAGTIIAVSGTENFVVSTTTISGTSLPVQSVTASSNHSGGDSVAALGFADVGHSLEDTVYNFYRAVLGITTTINKWNSTPRTVVATSVIGGDQAGTVSYVVWNLGYQVQGSGYDVSSNVSTSPVSWALFGQKSRLDGYQPLPPVPAFNITIGGQAVIFDEDTFTISYKENERWRCQFTVLDYAGNQTFPYRSQVRITDYNLGTLFTGFVVDDIFDKSNTYADVSMEHKIDCIGNEAKPDKRTSNRLYTVPTPAGQIALDMLSDVLTAEGVQANYASLETTTQSQWAAGTNTGTAAAANLPGGDLELAPAGAAVTKTEATTSDFSAGTLTNVTAANNTLTLTPHNAIKFTSYCNGIGGAGSSIFMAIWTGSYVIQSGDQLEFKVWCDGSSPEIKASMDAQTTDGNNLQGFNDQNVFTLSPFTDMAGYEKNQWFQRFVTIDFYAGKTISEFSVCFGGSSAGQYTAYYRDIKITNGGSTVLTIFSSTLQANQLLHRFSYVTDASQTNLSVVTAYEQSGSRTSPSTSLTSVGIFKSGMQSWKTLALPSGTSLVVSTSFDGGITWQAQSSSTPLAGLLAGASASGITLLTRQDFAITGGDPTQTPIVASVVTTINPSYTATKHDVVYTKSTTTDFSAGTLTNTTAQASNAGVTLTGAWRNWDNGSLANQTIFGSTSPSQINVHSAFALINAGNSDVRARFDFAGNTWNILDMSISHDIPTSGGTTANGLVYGTTNWGNSNDSYAYSATVSSTTLLFAKGNNSTGAGAFTSLATFTFPTAFTANSWHTLRVQWNGTASTQNGIPAHTHNIYVDGVLYISQVDASFTAAGYVGARMYNNSGVGTFQQGHFDNFSIVQSYANATWLSPNYSLNSVGICGNSVLFWKAVIPAVSSLLAETSIDGGASWQTATNGGQIPGLSNGVNLVGINLQVRFTFTEGIGAETILQGFTAWVISPYSSSGSWVSSLLSLATVGQVGSTFVAWAGLELPNTTIAADTSLDGGLTWATNVAPGALAVIGSNEYAGLGSIAGIVTQPSPTIDDFNSNTSGNYTSANGAGGSLATWAYDVSNGRIAASGGSKAIFAYNAISGLNIDLIADMDRSDAGGLTWCYSDATHYYSLVVADSQSSVATPNTVTLYRSGVSVATASIAFTRGILYRTRVTSRQGVITVVFDGLAVIAYTDSSPLPAGKHGLFSNGGTARIYNLWMQPLGDDVSQLSVKARLRLTSSDPTATPQVQQLSVAACGPQIGAGTLIPSADYRKTFINKNLDDAAKQSNYSWHINQNNQLIFNAPQARPSPWILQSNSLALPSDLEADNNLAVETAGDLYRNRQVLTGVINTAIFQDSFVGDGSATSFTLRYPIAPGTFPTLLLDGSSQTAGLKGSTGSAWYYAVGDATIAQDASALALGASDVLIVSYTGTFTDTVTVDNVAAQQALAPVEGGTGIVEAVEDVSSKNMMYAAAVTYGQQLLVRYCITGRTITFKTYRNGLAVGQALPVQVPEERLYYAQMLIHQIDLGMQTQPGNAVLYNYLVQASELPVESSWAKLIATGLLD